MIKALLMSNLFESSFPRVSHQAPFHSELGSGRDLPRIRFQAKCTNRLVAKAAGANAV